MHKDSTQILGFECGGVPLGIHYGKNGSCWGELGLLSTSVYNRIMKSPFEQPGLFPVDRGLHYRVIGILVTSQYKARYEPISIMECHKASVAPFVYHHLSESTKTRGDKKVPNKMV